ncbi:hypothetical protein D3C85_1419180 [compost metagenome]
MMKGRNPNAREKAFHTLLAEQIGCQACRKDYGASNHWVSIHHIDGRTKPWAHWYVLAACAGHHQKGYGADPKMLAIHGDKARFVEAYGSEMELLRQAIIELRDKGFALPPEALSII